MVDIFPLHFLLATWAGWLNRRQLEVIAVGASTGNGSCGARIEDMKAVVIQALGCAVFASGCFLPPGPPSPSSSTNSTTATTMETFSGTLAIKSSSLTTFSVVQAGMVEVTISSVGPPANIVVGLGLGIPSVTGTCNYSISNTSAVASSAPQIMVTEPVGQYCVEIYDVGNLTTAATFTITVSHS